MRAISSALFVMLPLISIPVTAQSVTAQSPGFSAGPSALAGDHRLLAQDRPSKKEPGTATIISLLVVGGGQIYAGEINRGLLMLGSAYGSLVAGAVLSSCDYSDCNYTPLTIGALAALGIYVYSIVDAAPSARRMNAKHGYTESSVSSLMRAGPHGTAQMGLRIAF